MKKSIVLAMAVAFLAATSGLVMAQDAAGTTPPKTHKTHKSKSHKHKKSSKSSASTSTSTAPPSSSDGTSPASK